MVTLSKSAGGLLGQKRERKLAYPIIEIDGVGEVFGRKLNEVGVRSTDHLLEGCRTPRGRKQMAAKTGIAEELLLKWTNHADLFRIKGVAKQYAELLDAAGVDSVKELKTRRADALSQALRHKNEEKHLCKVSPSVAVVKKWIDQAKTLQAKITY